MILSTNSDDNTQGKKDSDIAGVCVCVCVCVCETDGVFAGRMMCDMAGGYAIGLLNEVLVIAPLCACVCVYVCVCVVNSRERIQ